MQTVSHDVRTANVPPSGFGWFAQPLGKTTALAMSGASPGGVAILVVVPERDLAFAAFGNDRRAMPLHDQLLLSRIREYLHVELPDLVLDTTSASDVTRYAARTTRINYLSTSVL